MADLDINVDVDIANKPSIDRIINAHGDALIEFVVDGKLAILKGRIDPQNDNFTFVSPRGKSVVDYFIVPQDCFHSVKSSKVDVVTDLVSKHNCINQISPNSKLPDHWVLTTEIKCNTLEVHQNDASQATIENNKKRYKFPGNTEGYLYSEILATSSC